jgi:hypothetical protein
MHASGVTRAEQQQIGALLDPTVTGRERHHLGFADHGNGSEVEAIKRLARGQACLGEVAFNAATGTVGHLMLSKGSEEAGRRPALFIGLFRELGPHQFDARQAQFAEQQFDAGGVDGGDLLHAATSNAPRTFILFLISARRT